MYILCHAYFVDLTCYDDVPLLPGLEMRARNNFIDPTNGTSGVIDDSFPRLSWYKVTNYKGNFSMPDATTVPSEWSCGSQHQVYINGEIN